MYQVVIPNVIYIHSKVIWLWVYCSAYNCSPPPTKNGVRWRKQAGREENMKEKENSNQKIKEKTFKKNTL